MTLQVSLWYEKRYGPYNFAFYFKGSVPLSTARQFLRGSVDEINHFSSILSDTQSPLRLFLSVSLGFALLFLAFLPPGVYSLDGNSMLAVSESLVANHNVEVPIGLGLEGRDGHVYSSWYPLLSLVALPFVALAHQAAQVVHLPFHYVAAIFALVVQVPLTAATAGLVALLSLQLGATQRGAWLASLSFGLGTVAMVYVRTFLADPLLAFLVAASIYLAFRLTPRAIISCAFVTMLAVLAKPPGIFVGFVLSAYLFAKRVPWWRAALPALGSTSGLLLYALYNQLRFGNALQFGQPWIFSMWALPHGVLGLLFSPGWGLVWYCPPLLLAILGFLLGTKSKLLEVSTIAAIFAAFLLFHSIYLNWSAGWAWGPRYLVPAIPGLCSLTSLLTGKARKACAVLSLVGCLANAPTLFSYYERYLAELQEAGISQGADIAWSVSLSPVLHAWPAGIRQVKDASQQDVRELFSQRGKPSHRIQDSRALRVVAVWWWVLPIAGVPRWIGALIAAVLVGLGVLILSRSAEMTQ